MTEQVNICGRIYRSKDPTARVVRCGLPAGHTPAFTHQESEGSPEWTDQEVGVVPGYGTAEHAEALGLGRHPGTRDALQWLTFSHLPPALQRYSVPFYTAAVNLVTEIRTDSPELTTALNRLVEAKDSAVRAGIKADTGRAGPVPRPQTVVNLPIFEAGRG
jgi:hypothetical protein